MAEIKDPKELEKLENEGKVKDLNKEKEKRVNKKIQGGKGFRQPKKPTKAEVIGVFNNRVGSLEKQMYGLEQKVQGIMHLLGRITSSIKGIEDKLEEDVATTRAFHNLLTSKKVLKEKELNAEVERVMKIMAQEDEERKDKQMGLKDKGADAVVEKGDLAIISYEGTLHGEDKPFEGGIANNVLLQVGSGSYVEGFEDQLIGHKVGETGIVTVTFPDEYKEELRGKTADFKVTIHKIKLLEKREEEPKKEEKTDE